MRFLAEALARQHGRLLPFFPVGLGCGIGVWFGLAQEPTAALYAAVALYVGALAAGVLWAAGARPVLIFAAALGMGFLLCGGRAWMVAAPILGGEVYGPVTGRVVLIDRSQAGALRITLDRVWIAELPPQETPARVRLSLQGDRLWHDPQPGQVVMATAFLSPPPGPVEPGAFDFRRDAFFDGLGAVGYTRHPALLWEEAAPGEARIGRLRAYLSGAIRAAIPGDAGAFAAGVMTGDRSGLSVEAVAALRDSSLAHLLAISGMNMAFLTAFVFALLRFGLALIPPAALRVNGKKIAAVVALGAALFYLLLSGANVATERAFIMVAVMLGAVLMDRRAITLRSVAVAGTVILFWQPEALLSPGFQMSFAATIALILGFGWWAERMARRQWSRGAQFVATLVLSSLLGGLATAPFAAAHFNRFTDYGLIANLLTGPVMAAVVMPAGVMAALLWPFGLAPMALWVLEMGCRWILFVAHEVARLEGAVTAIPAPPGAVLPVLTLGLCWLCFWQGRARWAGVAPVMVALVLWMQGARPTVLIGGEGVVGVMGPEGRALSAARGDGFMLRNWLENDGDLARQAVAAGRAGFAEGPMGAVFALGTGTGVILSRPEQAEAACRAHAIVVMEAGPLPQGACLAVTPERLRRSGTLAVMVTGDGMALRVTHPGRRLWSRDGVDDPARFFAAGQ
ncbi:competence protein [Tabrizicola sp. TH137]|uniref:ComEC/Rec2 family competence protein n=1 Tax=Tabrizicola sp. TH137 TaxID=2067452 RepID=UPI000C7E4EC7|nr:ComEC/Rec2 family competence protein [Tabrizicola sp. TH137]PLL13006.1 competence protein [Tabrizicola sp. TH137]